MSADNWAVCPRCITEAKAEHALLCAQVAEGYGTLPLDEFDTLRTRAAEGIDEEKYRTFREDYEVYGAEEGVVQVSYSGHCEKCGCGLDFKDERLVLGVKNGSPETNPVDNFAGSTERVPRPGGTP